jgi:hypothetical protein
MFDFKTIFKIGQTECQTTGQTLKFLSITESWDNFLSSAQFFKEQNNLLATKYRLTQNSFNILNVYLILVLFCNILSLCISLSNTYILHVKLFSNITKL